MTYETRTPGGEALPQASELLKEKGGVWGGSPPQVVCLLICALFCLSPLHAEEIETLRALVVPVRETLLASPMTGRIREMSVRQGEGFKEGALLVAFDCQLFRAQLDKFRAQLEGAEKVHQVNQVRLQQRAIGDLEAALSAVAIKERKAEVAASQAQVNLCQVHAPFAGRVVKQLARAHQAVREGEPLLEILDDSHLELQAFVPSAWLRWIKPGTPFTVDLDETGQSVAATVARLGAKVDPSSRTVEVIGALTGSATGLLAGMSGAAHFQEPHGQ